MHMSVISSLISSTISHRKIFFPKLNPNHLSLVRYALGVALSDQLCESNFGAVTVHSAP